MIYHGTYTVECIAVYTMDNMRVAQFIELKTYADQPTFSVECSYDEDWYYEFYIESVSDYERVKFNIMKAISECETMEELLDMLSEIFEDGFEDILIEDALIEEECDGDCAHCERNNN